MEKEKNTPLATDDVWDHNAEFVDKSVTYDEQTDSWHTNRPPPKPSTAEPPAQKTVSKYTPKEPNSKNKQKPMQQVKKLNQNDEEDYDYDDYPDDETQEYYKA